MTEDKMPEYTRDDLEAMDEEELDELSSGPVSSADQYGLKDKPREQVFLEE